METLERTGTGSEKEGRQKSDKNMVCRWDDDKKQYREEQYREKFIERGQETDRD